MTITEAAQLARVSADTIRRAFDRGEITGRRTSPGGNRKLDRASVVDWIKASGGDVRDA